MAGVGLIWKLAAISKARNRILAEGNALQFFFLEEKEVIQGHFDLIEIGLQVPTHHDRFMSLDYGQACWWVRNTSTDQRRNYRTSEDAVLPFAKQLYGRGF